MHTTKGAKERVCVSPPGGKDIVPSLQDNIPFILTTKLLGYLELIETSLKIFPHSALILGSFSDFWASD